MAMEEMAAPQEPAPTAPRWRSYFAVDVDGVAVGSVTLARLDSNRKPHTAELAYWLGRPFWGRGIMTRVISEIITVARSLGYLRLTAEVYAPNEGSTRVLVKNGFAVEGRMVEGLLNRGELVDGLLLGRWIGPDVSDSPP